MIELLSTNNIKCYIFNIKNNHEIIKNNHNDNIILLPNSLSNSELNNYYNKSIIGCTFSDKYNDKTCFNMLLSGLKVIEYNNKITSFDLPSFIFTKINLSENITENIREIIDELFKPNDTYNNTYNEYLNKYNNFLVDDHVNSVCNYIINM